MEYLEGVFGNQGAMYTALECPSLSSRIHLSTLHIVIPPRMDLAATLSILGSLLQTVPKGLRKLAISLDLHAVPYTSRQDTIVATQIALFPFAISRPSLEQLCFIYEATTASSDSSPRSHRLRRGDHKDCIPPWTAQTAHDPEIINDEQDWFRPWLDVFRQEIMRRCGKDIVLVARAGVDWKPFPCDTQDPASSSDDSDE
ncbi:hypothetical protein PsYK624_129910 [Phanerochaete sordida]|uniref:Uncharacterized protein n=1 Tax=Phanerochaete sordida TaxID=48140 RepID=A0A9P3GKB3_9APHY|nr:hypothetical protein PsYK624_129910 [Phanerochaete sordida]